MISTAQRRSRVRTAHATVFASAFAVIAIAVSAAPARAIDTDAWDRVLQRHANRGGMDYGALKADAQSMTDLNAAYASLGSMPVSAPLVDWLNAYNIVVVKAIVDRYPLRTVRDVPGFFDRVTHRVGGQARTLDAVENQVIRVRFPDARVHAALNCGAASCPALYGRAFRAGSLEATLDRLARSFVASNNHVRINNGRIEASMLFNWFRTDFERDGGGSVIGWMRRYDQRNRLAGLPDTVTITHRNYSWALNDRVRPAGVAAGVTATATPTTTTPATPAPR
jgi:hypothetical protein